MTRRKTRHGTGWFHRIIEFIRRLVEAIQHVRSGGRTTRSRARFRAAAPPRPCPTCHQPMKHSDDWRDHLDHA